MAHYALLDENNVVVQVITGRDEGELGIDWEELYAQETGYASCKRTSYNTRAGKYVDEHSEPTDEALQYKAFRKNYAGIGYIYDPVRDAFVPPMPDGDGWILNEDTCLWEKGEQP